MRTDAELMALMTRRLLACDRARELSEQSRLLLITAFELGARLEIARLVPAVLEDDEPRRSPL
jgi:hypothetical protein